MRRVLAFDPGYHLGWAFFEDEKLISSGVYHALGANKKGLRFERLQLYIRALMDKFEPDEIFLEQVRRWMSSDSALAYNGCLALILIEAGTTECAGFAPTSIKKHATGNGKATKEDMIKAANELYDITVEDDNEADAVLVGRLALAT